jgi:thiol-disulfide isomerase/thioredoxin
MKNIFTLLLILTGSFLQAQSTFEISIDTNHTNAKVYKGLISKNILKADTSFKWYQANYNSYIPDTSVLNTFRKSHVQFIVFGGTWCDDTQFILPHFFKILELAGISDEQIVFFGVNRKKESIGNVSKTFGITNVPTIIVMKEGKETGRVLEYGKTGNWDRELADIISSF